MTLLTPEQVAERLNISERTLTKWRAGGKGPAFARLNARCVCYSSEALDAWVQSRNASAAGGVPAALALAPITINLPGYSSVNGLYGDPQSANDLVRLMTQAMRLAKSTT